MSSSSHKRATEPRRSTRTRVPRQPPEAAAAHSRRRPVTIDTTTTATRSSSSSMTTTTAVVAGPPPQVTPPSATTTKATTITKLPSIRLGLQRPNTPTILPLTVGQILGRNRNNRRSSSSSTNSSTSLGLTQTNAAAIPREVCWVRGISTMRNGSDDNGGGTILLERCGGTSSSSSSCLYYRRAGTTTQRIKWDHHHNMHHHHLTLHVGDSLCFRNKPKPSKTTTTKSSAVATTVWHEFVVTRLVEDNPENDTTRRHFTRNRYPLQDGTPFVMNHPYPHHYDWVAAVPSSPSSMTTSTPSPSSSTQEVEVVTVESSSSSSCHPDEDVVNMDEDLEYDSEDDPEKDCHPNNKTTMMHMTLANTYGKALLESRTPSMGLHLLDLVATATSNSSRRLPTLPLVQDLVQVVTYGPTHSKAAKDPRRLEMDHHHGNDNDHDEDIRSCKYRKTMGRPYWDATRMASAHTYLSSLWERYSQQIPRLFVQALPPHYFDTILVDQIVSLVYTDQTTSTTEDDALLHSLQLQVYALGFAERLLSSQDSTFLSYLQDYNEGVGSSRQVGNLAAKALALILVRYGSNHWTTTSSSSSKVFVVLYELVGILGRLTHQTLLLDKKSRPLSEAVEILYNAWESAWQDHYHYPHHPHDKTTTTRQKKKHKGSLTRTWIESFLTTNDEDDSSSLARALAKRCRLTQVIFPTK